ncbi:MAG: RsmE family RNA methyltransferase [Bacteriovoracaceae bacterium]
MRALYLPEDFVEEGETLIKGEKLHHLLNVARVKKDQEIVLLNGKGSKAFGQVAQIDKNKLKILVSGSTTEKRPKHLAHLGFGAPKKDALENCLRSCVELGIEKIYLLECERSQKYPLKEERLERIIIAGMEQSNNPFRPDITVCALKDAPLERYANIFLASLKKGGGVDSETKGDSLLLIGPEGGFSQDEEESVLRLKGAAPLNFSTPILRTQTAVPALSAYLAAKLEP